MEIEAQPLPGRGQSMLQTHANALQLNREVQARSELRTLFPRLGDPALELALEESSWDVERSAQLLRAFTAAHSPELEKIAELRTKLELRAAAHSEASAPHEDDSDSGERRRPSEGQRDSRRRRSSRERDSDRRRSSRERDSDRRRSSRERDSDRRRSSRERDSDRRRSSRERDSDRRRSSREHRSSLRRDDSEGRRESSRDHRSSRTESSRRERDSSRDRRSSRRRSSPGDRRSSRHRGDSHRGKDRKRSRQEPETSGTGYFESRFGLHGILRDADMDAKRREFAAWADDVKNINVGVLPRSDALELFREFAEEYNTSSLPHPKYYDMAKYEREQASAGGDREAPRSVIDDERELQRQVAAERARLQHERIKEAYREMASGGMAKDMRAQDVLRAQIRNAYRMGNTGEAQKLAARLAPDDNK